MDSLEVHGSLIVRESKILMSFSEEEEVWIFPQGKCERGELGADTAERIAEEFTDCPSQVTKYRKRLKTKVVEEEVDLTWQPYQVEIEGEPEKGEWVPLDSLKEKETAPHITEIKEKIVKRL